MATASILASASRARKICNKQLYAKWVLPCKQTGQTPTLVFLHHGLGSVAQWKTFPLKLCRELSMPGLVFDRTGHGNSNDFHSESIIYDYLKEEAQNWNIMEELRNFKSDILLLQGSEDIYGSQKQIDLVAKQIRGRVESAMINNCGHNPFYEAEQETLKIIARYIEEIS